MATELWDCTCGATEMRGKFCTKCGKKYETVQEELAAAKAEQVSVEIDNGWTCPNCGTTGRKGKFCTKCGYKFGELLTTEEKNIENEYENSKTNYVIKQQEYEETDSLIKKTEPSIVEKAIGSVAAKLPPAEEIGDKLKTGIGELQEQIKKQDIGSKVKEGMANVKTEANNVQEKIADSIENNNYSQYCC